MSNTYSHIIDILFIWEYNGLLRQQSEKSLNAVPQKSSQNDIFPRMQDGIGEKEIEMIESKCTDVPGMDRIVYVSGKIYRVFKNKKMWRLRRQSSLVCCPYRGMYREERVDHGYYYFWERRGERQDLTPNEAEKALYVVADVEKIKGELIFD